MDKNGDLIFDVDEARDIHNNAVHMLKRAVGVDVLTTFTDVDSIVDFCNGFLDKCFVVAYDEEAFHKVSVIEAL